MPTALAPAPLRLVTTERPRPTRIREARRGWWLAVAAVCFGAFMGQLDASIVTLAYPALRRQFHAGLASVEWVSLAYLIVLITLLVPAGRLSDAYGRKLMYLYGFILFTASSAACGLAPGLGALIAFRALQAGGAALLQANSVALVSTSAPPGRARAALGVQAGAQALGLALGPTVGGVIVSSLGWRWVFLVNVPVGLAAVVAGHYLLPRTRTRVSAAGFDRIGLALLAVSAVSLLTGISAASGLDLPPAAVVGLFVLAAASGWGLVRRLRTAADPLVDPTLFRERRIAAGLAGALGGYLVLFGPLVLVPVELTARGVGLAQAGLVLTALPAGFAAAAVLGDRILPSRWSDRRRALTGAAAALAAATGLAVAPMAGAWLVPLLALLGLGLGAFTPANNAMVMSAIPGSRAGMGGGLVNMTRGLGTALGVALVTLCLSISADNSADGARLAGAVLAAGAAGVLASAVLL